MPRIVTIGVGTFTLSTFVEQLRAAGFVQLLDTRQRRGVRGPECAWASSHRLQPALAAVGIEYRHCRELAPTTELRRSQSAEEARQGVGKRNRRARTDRDVRRYHSEILDHADREALVSQVPTSNPAGMLCVERDPEACHRSLIARRLDEQFGVTVEHLRPS